VPLLEDSASFSRARTHVRECQKLFLTGRLRWHSRKAGTVATHGYYWTAHWRALRKAALQRDGYCCTVGGCDRCATHVDHIKTRPRRTEPAPEDRLDNLRSLCSVHDAQIKERSSGRRGHTRKRELMRQRCVDDRWPTSCSSKTTPISVSFY
jgi:5-methylcytosine-specific restriction endonuclease McrA